MSLPKFNANADGIIGFCNDCLFDDKREDHEFECECYCHHRQEIKFLKTALAIAWEFIEACDRIGISGTPETIRRIEELGK